MHITHNNAKALDGTLEDVFMRGLSAPELRQLHDAFFYKALGYPEPQKSKRKAEMATALMELSSEPDKFAKCIKALPQQECAAYAYLIWQEQVRLPVLESELGFSVHEKYEERDWRQSYQIFTTKPEFVLIGLAEHKDRNSLYTHPSNKTAKDFDASIPPAIRKWLKPHFPKPAGYDIAPLTEAQFNKESYSLFDASASILTDLAQLSDFLNRGNIARTKKGNFTKACIRKAAQLIQSGDWYPDKKATPLLTLMRPEMLLSFVEDFSDDLSAQLTDSQPQATIIKTIFKEVRANTDTVAKYLLAHLLQRFAYDEDIFDESKMARLFDLFGNLSTDAWVSIANLKSMQFYQDIDILFYQSRRYQFRKMTGSLTYNYESHYDLDKQYLQAVGIDPLINGMAFLLSAFGLVELAYTLPNNEHYYTEKTPYLSPYDGAVAIRLTPVGAYAYGKTDQLKLAPLERKVAQVSLHPEHLCASCDNLDPITETALDEYMEKVSPKFYKMTRASMLKGCQTADQVKARIRDFRQRIPAELPQNWEAFLSALANEGNVLREEPLFVVFSLADRLDLQRHFLQEPELSSLALRVEGHRVAIERQNIPKVRRHLRKLGYLVES